MVRYFLRLDYALAEWFAKKKDRVVPATAHMFLSKVSFLYMLIFFIVYKVLGSDLTAELFVGIVVVGIAVVMYGFQNLCKRIVNLGNYREEYKKIPRRKLIIRRVLGLFYLILIYTLVFVVGYFTV